MPLLREGCIVDDRWTLLPEDATLTPESDLIVSLERWQAERDRLLIDLSFNSSRLEGNTYSLLETQRLIELGKPFDYKVDGDTAVLEIPPRPGLTRRTSTYQYTLQIKK